MATSFNLTAKLNLAGPYNVRPVVSALQSQLSKVKANITLNVSSSTVNNLNTLNGALRNLNRLLTSASTNAANLRASLNGIASALNGAATNVNKNATAIAALANRATSAGKALRSASSDMEKFGKEAGLAVKRAGAFAVATGAIFGLARAIGGGISKAVDFEKGIVKLVQVTGQSKAGLRGLTDEIDRLSISLGTSSHDLLEVAKIFTQAGLSLRDTKTAMEAVAKSTLAPSFDNIINTTEGLIAVVGQFKDEMTGAGITAKDFEKVLGSINKVSADFAVEADDIVSAIRRTGGVFAAASRGIGTPIDQLNELIAVFTSVRATTRESADSIATGLRTIFTRIQRPQTIEFLREFGVELTDLNGKFVGPYEAIKRLSEALSQIDSRDIRFARITEELGGIRQVGKLIPAIKEFSTAQDALRTAYEGQGSLSKDAETAQLSLANRIAKTREEFLKLIRDISNTSSFQAIARGALEMASAFIRVADSVKELIPIITALFAIRGLRSGSDFLRGFVGTFKDLKVARKAEGGPVYGFARGGLVPGSGEGDTVPANLTPGEFVIRKKAVQAIGMNRLNKMNGYANGGAVRMVRGGGVTRKYGDDIDLTGPQRDLVDRLEAEGYSTIGGVSNNKGVFDIAGTGKRDAKAFGVSEDDFFQAQLYRYNPSGLSKGKAKEKLKKELASSGTYSVVIGDKSKPSFGGLFLRPAPGSDLTRIQNVGISSLEVPNRDIVENVLKSNLKKANGDLDDEAMRKAMARGRVFANMEFGFIEAESSEKISNSILESFRGGVQNLVDNFGGKAATGGKSITNELLENTGLKSVSGHMFEGFVNAVTNNLKAVNEATFDIDDASKLQNIEHLFGDVKANKLDIKRSYSSDAVTSLFNKAISSNLGQDIHLLNDKDSTGNRVTFLDSAEKSTSRGKRLFAKGGSATDTVPALLTPGEFVINRDAAARIGSRRLNQLNHADKVLGFARGGRVPFADGGSSVDDLRTRLFEKTQGTLAGAKSQVTGVTPGGVFTTKATEYYKELDKLAEKAKKLGINIDEVINAADDMETAFNATGDVKQAAKEASKTLYAIGKYKLDQELKNLGASAKERKIAFDDLKKGSSIEDIVSPAKTAANAKLKLQRDQAINKKNEDDAKKQADRDASTARLQRYASGAIFASGALAYALPEGKSASASAAKSGLVGAGSGFGVGAEIGSILGPWFGLAGGAIGSFVGAVDGMTHAFYEFEKNGALKELEQASNRVSSEFEKIKFETTDFSKILSGVSEIQNLSSKKQEAQRNQERASISGNTFSGLNFIYRDITDAIRASFLTEDASQLLGGKSGAGQIARQDIIANISGGASDIQADRSAASKILKQSLGLKNFDPSKLGTEELFTLGIGENKLFEQAKLKAADVVQRQGKRGDKDAEDAAFKGAIIALTRESLQAGGELNKFAEKSKKIRESQENLANVTALAARELDLFSHRLSEAAEIGEKFKAKQEGEDELFNAALGRAGGGNNVSSKRTFFNPFANPLAATPDDVLKGTQLLKNLGVAPGKLEGTENTIISGKEIIKDIPAILAEIGKTDTGEEGKGIAIGKFVEKYKGSLPETFLNSFQAKLGAYVDKNQSATKAPLSPEEIKNLEEEFNPLVSELNKFMATLFKDTQEGLEKYQQKLQQLADFQISNNQALFDIERDRQDALRNIEEERTGRVDLKGRFAAADQGVARLTGGITDPTAIADKIAALQDKIKEDEKGLGDKEVDQKALAESLVKNNSELIEHRKALTILSKNTEKLSAVQAKLTEVQSRNASARGLAQRFATGSFEDRARLRQSVEIANAFKFGDEEAKKRILASKELATKLYEGIEVVRGFSKKGAGDLENEATGLMFGDKFKDLFNIDEENKLVEEQKALINEAAAAAKLQLEANKKMSEGVIPGLQTLIDSLNARVDKAGVAVATGGYIKGPGTGTSDSIKAVLSNGEFVIKASSVKSLGKGTLDHINTYGRIPGFAVGGSIEDEIYRSETEREKRLLEEKMAEEYRRRVRSESSLGSILFPEKKEEVSEVVKPKAVGGFFDPEKTKGKTGLIGRLPEGNRREENLRRIEAYKKTLPGYKSPNSLTHEEKIQNIIDENIRLTQERIGKKGDHLANLRKEFGVTESKPTIQIESAPVKNVVSAATQAAYDRAGIGQRKAAITSPAKVFGADGRLVTTGERQNQIIEEKFLSAKRAITNPLFDMQEFQKNKIKEDEAIKKKLRERTSKAINVNNYTDTFGESGYTYQAIADSIGGRGDSLFDKLFGAKSRLGKAHTAVDEFGFTPSKVGEKRKTGINLEERIGSSKAVDNLSNGAFGQAALGFAYALGETGTFVRNRLLPANVYRDEQNKINEQNRPGYLKEQENIRLKKNLNESKKINSKQIQDNKTYELSQRNKSIVSGGQKEKELRKKLLATQREQYDIVELFRNTKFANGGPTSDSILARVSNGEYIIRADSAARIGNQTLDHINKTGSLPRFASGGSVGTPAYNANNKQPINLSGFLDGFNKCVGRLEATLKDLKIPTEIQMTGRHEVVVTHNGLQILASMNDSIRNLVTEEINKAINKNINLQQRIEGA